MLSACGIPCSDAGTEPFAKEKGKLAVEERPMAIGNIGDD
jgi:hypothetical protein